MSLPVGQPTEFTIGKVELKKTLDPKKPGDPSPVVVKLGLIAPDGSKDWSEMWCPAADKVPMEGAKETLVLTQPDNPAWSLKASRPRSGGGRGGRSPQETKAIQAQSARRDAIEYARIVANETGKAPTLEKVREWMGELESWV